MASRLADIKLPAMLEVDEPSLGDTHQILAEVQGTIKQLLKTSFQLGTDITGVQFFLRVPRYSQLS